MRPDEPLRCALIGAGDLAAAIIDSSDDAVVSSNLASVITSWNPGAGRMFGFAAHEVIGTSILRFVPESRKDEETRVLAEILRGQRVESFETVRLHQDGRSVCVSITASPVRDGAGHVVGVARIARDISTQKQHQREIARLSRLYAALRHVHQAITSLPTRDELFRRVCQVLAEHGGLKMAWIGWHDTETHRLVPVAECGDERGYLKSVEVYADDRAEGRGPSGTAFRTGRPYVCNDMLSDPVTMPWREALEHSGFRSVAAFPIRTGDEIRGTLNVYADDPRFFQVEEIALLEEAARDLSLALDNLAREEARRQAEQQVRHERDFSEAVLKSLPGVLYLFDQDGRFLSWNKEFERVTGCTAQEVSAMHPLDFFPEEDKAVVAARIAEVFESGASSVEAGFLSKDGRVTPYFFTGTRAQIDGRTCLIGVGIDVTRRREAEDARRTSEARYRTLFEQAPDGIVIADPESWYVDANGSVCRMLGYARDELIGLHASDIVVPAELPHVGPALDAIKARRPYHRLWWFRHKDGTEFPAEVTATLMPDGRLLGMLRDVTERMLAEKSLRELNETLEQKVTERTGELRAALVRAEAADRIKSAFLATMSHELRTPLNSIIGFTGILLQGLTGPLNPEQTRQLGMVRGSAGHLLELINDVLDLSKIEAGQMAVRAEPFDLRASLDQVLASVRPLAERKGLVLAEVVGPALEGMHGDKRRVEQILLNLLQNAIKFTDRGTVTLAAELVDGPVAAPGSAAPLPAVRLRVTDTGIGIAPADLATLFQPFRQIDSGLARRHEGTGLGLAICRRLAALLGGAITAESTPGEGSAFTVVLPLRRAG